MGAVMILDDDEALMIGEMLVYMFGTTIMTDKDDELLRSVYSKVVKSINELPDDGTLDQYDFMMDRPLRFRPMLERLEKMPNKFIVQ